MAGKTVLVTGGTGGIGLATATGLAHLGASVGIVGRDSSRAAAAADRIRAAGGGEVQVFTGDLSSQREVRAVAEQVLTAYPRLDVLVNNVGGYWATRHTTEDGLERTFAVNHLAPFLLTNLLLDRLTASAPARVVTVSSGAQAMGRLDFDDLQGARSYRGQRAYNQSKLANVMFTYELSRRLEGTGVTANVLHPGVVRTAFAAEDPSMLWRIMIPIMRPGLVTAALFGAIFIWNEFLVALYVIDSRDYQTISLGAATLVSAQRPIDWNIAAAVGVVTVIPILIFSLVVQRYIVRGLTVGAVK
jgi:NAD(P)-dependent dehydrogenase (short-subunit alcohol dehydrogenase family)